MTLHRAIIFTTGAFIALGFAEAQAGDPPEPCQLTIEINALRGGSPTVTAGENQTRNITAKARIVKGTAPKGTTIDTTLQIEVKDKSEVIHRQTKSPIRLVVGKGGQGAKLLMNIPQCSSGSIDFVATFFGNDGNGPCEATRTINKICK
jgi:hypothetical protein